MLHLIPSLVIMILFIPYFLQPVAHKLALLEMQDDWLWTSNPGAIAHFAFYHIVFLSYITVTLKMLFRARNKIISSGHTSIRLVYYTLSFFGIFYLLNLTYSFLHGFEILAIKNFYTVRNACDEFYDPGACIHPDQQHQINTCKITGHPYSRGARQAATVSR